MAPEMFSYATYNESVDIWAVGKKKKHSLNKKASTYFK
jgi:hypothetical protein